MFSPSQTSLPSPSHPTLQPVTEPLFESPESYSKFPLAIYFTNILQISLLPSSTSHPLLPPLPLCPQVCSLCLFLHCCPENKFISTIFLNSVYMLQYAIFVSLSNLLHSVQQALGSSTSLELTQLCSLLWLSRIPLYTCITVSLSIRLSMDIQVASMFQLL